jgi:3',5'-cyclic-AMP phosphodiesterase
MLAYIGLGASGETALKFVHITDPHLVAPGMPPFGINPIGRFEACLHDIAAHHQDAAFCVVTGDLAEHGDLATYELLKQRLGRFPLTTHLLLGNCDDRRNFIEVFGGGDDSGHVQSVARHGGSSHMFLDTLGEKGSAEGHYDSGRQDWLRRQLAAASGGPVFLYMHHPPLEIGHANDAIGLRDRESFSTLLEGHSIRHIFFGHMHRPVNGQWRGIGFSGLPGLPFQIPLVPSSVATRLSDEPPMYGVVMVRHDAVVVHYDAFLHRTPLAQDWKTD